MAVTTDLYKYSPSVGAAVFFAILFGITTLIHTYQIIRTRTWFLIPFLVGGYCEYHPYLQMKPFCTQPSAVAFGLMLITFGFLVELGGYIAVGFFPIPFFDA
jgi:hypothetical protein